MCDPEQTLETVRILKSSYPGLLVCISTNGLNLTEYVDELAEYGVTHVTVTINAVDPLMGSRIYSRVTLNRRTYGGIEGAKLLWSRQREAVVKLKARGLVVKINTVVIPGLNSGHIDAIAEEAATLGADLMNCIPMIPLPDTPFSPLGEPSGAEMDRIRGLASRHIPQMYHCRRCRADAVGRLCLDERHLSLLDPASAGVGVEGNLQRLSD